MKLASSRTLRKVFPGVGISRMTFLKQMGIFDELHTHVEIEVVEECLVSSLYNWMEAGAVHSDTGR